MRLAAGSTFLSLTIAFSPLPARSAEPQGPTAHIMRVRSFASDVKRDAAGATLVDGKFFLNSSDPTQFLTRILDDGTVDLTFARNIARIYAPTAVAPGVYALDIARDGKILVAAAWGEGAESIAGSDVYRLFPDGRLDKSFSTGDFFGDGTAIFDLEPLPDGKILAAGRFRANARERAAYMVRLNPDGKPDPSFRAGQRPLDTYGLAAYAVARLKDGTLLIGKAPWRFETVAVGNDEHRLTKVGPDGREVESFGRAASTRTREGIHAIAALPDGRVAAGGPATLVRLAPSGAPDPTFVPPAIVATRPQLPFAVKALKLQPDGRLLVGGDFITPGGTLGLMRLLPDGTLDGEFEKNLGEGFRANGTDHRGVSAIEISRDGKIIIAGSFTTLNGLPARSVVRLLPDGTPESYPAISEVGLPF